MSELKYSPPFYGRWTHSHVPINWFLDYMYNTAFDLRWLNANINTFMKMFNVFKFVFFVSIDIFKFLNSMYWTFKQIYCQMINVDILVHLSDILNFPICDLYQSLHSAFTFIHIWLLDTFITALILLMLSLCWI